MDMKTQPSYPVIAVLVIIQQLKFIPQVSLPSFSILLWNDCNLDNDDGYDDTDGSDDDHIHIFEISDMIVILNIVKAMFYDDDGDINSYSNIIDDLSV